MTTKRANISLFYGDYREGETPHTWLRNFELETTMSGFDEPKKMDVFRICMIPGEESGDWWEEMRTRINRTKWEEVRRAFETKWPAPKKSGHERDMKRYELVGLRIGPEEVGEMVEYRGRTVPTHHAFAEKTLALASTIGDTSGLLIEEVRRNLPDAIRKLIANESYANWQEFHDSLLAIRTPALAEAKNDANIIRQLTEAIRNGETQQISTLSTHPMNAWRTPLPRGTQPPTQTPTTPIATNRQVPYTPATRMTTAATPTPQRNLLRTPSRQDTTPTQFNSPTNPFITPARSLPQNDTPQPMYNASLYDIWRPYPSSQAGQAAYERTVNEWRKLYAGSRATTDNPFPLRPGSAYLDSRECFQCGLRGHLSRDCAEPQERRVPAEEREWRADYATLRNQQRQQQRAPMVANISEIEQGNGEEPPA
jgi:hypothetical protein